MCAYLEAGKCLGVCHAAVRCFATGLVPARRGKGDGETWTRTAVVGSGIFRSTS